jgi:hypothetical protein
MRYGLKDGKLELQETDNSASRIMMWRITMTLVGNGVNIPRH